MSNYQRADHSSTPRLSISAAPHWMAQREDYAFANLRRDVADATFGYGEWVMVILMWTMEDFKQGLVGRCPTCYLDYGRIAEVYQQPAKRICPDCYGTTFEGGVRAKLRRPAIFDDSDQDEGHERRGAVTRSSANVSLWIDFTINTNDYLVRRDNTRWQIHVPDLTNLYHGFGNHADVISGVAQSLSANLEDGSSVVYTIPPTVPEDIEELLDTTPDHFVGPLDDIEVNGPLYLSTDQSVDVQP